MTDKYLLVVREPIKLLKAVIDEFCGNAHISLEGDLSQCDLRGLPVMANESVGVLSRNTLQPKQDFVVLNLEENTKNLIERQILSRVGLRNRVIHILIEKNGKLVFAAYDNFYPRSVWISADVTEEFLKSLIASNSIKEYQIAPS